MGESPVKKLTVNVERGGDGVWVYVQDTGGGIAPENRDRVFEKDFTTKREGNGLGLYAAKIKVEAHQGKIGVLETGPAGTTFAVYLPRG
ncbi:hypothetical protein A3I48_01845 [Candidatus Daviesbacteria bacterium RIFCSPLOWO2_02_FULL_36_7]|uniref:histidine kinase n=1 Tax=Candidatus Daviesbacteria bacterium RIFCSPLOWO2_02_FULL_36_7 TaxID=1797792 RepID=A0A1F5MHF7_9BACT|nr:MAG: hypothetical protein A3I48_01845 [Candidatus Daviesbacteria bacterium RIFCSPLOWO2_02_FULL_36_7]